MTILLDVESRSRCDLKKHGGRLYWEHPSTEAICVVLHDTDTGERALWLPGDPPPYGPGEDVGAHNWSGFDRFATWRLGWPEPRTEIDTSELARRAGLPGALDMLGFRWFGRHKDKAESKFTTSLSTCRRPTAKSGGAIAPAEWKTFTPEEKRERGVQKALTPEIVKRVVGYCSSDVDIMADGWPLLRPFHEEGVFAGWEGDVLAVDRIVNDRGIRFDTDLAKALLVIDERNQAKAISAAAKVIGWSYERTRDAAESPEQFADATGAPNAQAATVEAIIADPDSEPESVALALARQSLATIAAGKCEAGLAGVSPDGRIRDMHKYCGAHTYRWSGRRLQVHNFPRPEKRFEDWHEPEVAALVARALRGAELDNGEIMVALRAALTASEGNTLIVEDFSGVEARGTAWLAGDRKAIDVFLSGRDVYKVNATQIFLGTKYDDVSKVQRTAGKMAELACGYQGGPGALTRIASANGVDLDALHAEGLVPSPKEIVGAWRNLHPPIVKLWRLAQDAFLSAAGGHAVTVRAPGGGASLEFVPSDDGRDVAIFLPSGRPIVYDHVGVTPGKYGPEAYYVAGFNPVWKCSTCGAKEPAPIAVRPTDRSQCPARCGGIAIPVGLEKVYGGLITENVVQAICRDMLADALVRCEEAGLAPVLHVHDELVNDVPKRAAKEAAAEMHQIMITLPEWAEGFPVGAAGHTGERYRK